MTKNRSHGDFDIVFQHVVSPQVLDSIETVSLLFKTNKALKSYFIDLLVILVGRDRAVFRRYVLALGGLYWVKLS